MTILAERTASAFLAGMLAGLTSLDVCDRGIAPTEDDPSASVGASPHSPAVGLGVITSHHRQP